MKKEEAVKTMSAGPQEGPLEHHLEQLRKLRKEFSLLDPSIEGIDRALEASRLIDTLAVDAFQQLVDDDFAASGNRLRLLHIALNLLWAGARSQYQRDA